MISGISFIDVDLKPINLRSNVIYVGNLLVRKKLSLDKITSRMIHIKFMTHTNYFFISSGRFTSNIEIPFESCFSLEKWK